MKFPTFMEDKLNGYMWRGKKKITFYSKKSNPKQETRQKWTLLLVTLDYIKPTENCEILLSRSCVSEDSSYRSSLMRQSSGSSSQIPFGLLGLEDECTKIHRNVGNNLTIKTA
jgi:hypothetical protein